MKHGDKGVTAHKEVFSKTGNSSGNWTGAVVRLGEGANVVVTFGLSVGTETNWLALDDVRFTDCDPGHLNGPGECDFELGTCDYFNINNRDDFDWTRHQGPTPSYATGPKADHTTQTAKGWYYYIETSSPRQPGDTASAQSRWLTRDSYSQIGQQCKLEYWYHMMGDHIGSLNVYQVTDQGYMLLQNLTKARTEDWTEDVINLPHAGRPFKLEFEGIRGDSYEGDIALDDIELDECPVSNLCSREDHDCTGANCVPTERVCDLYDDCGDNWWWLDTDERKCATCNFEEGQCGWTNEKIKDDFDWLRYAGGTSSWGTGPPKDHTFGDSKGCGKIVHLGGKCVHPLMGNPNPGDMTPIVTYAGCTEDRLQFCWTDEGDLKHLTSGLCIQPESGKDVPGSNTILVLGDNCGSSFTKFSFTAGGSIKQDSSGLCWHPLNGSPNPNDNNKIVVYKGCDQDRLQFAWHGKPGTYMYVEASAPRKPGDKATMTSPRFPVTGSECELEFWYHMTGSGIGMLLVNIDEKYSTTNVLSLVGDQGDKWQKASIPIGHKKEFSYTMIATIGGNYQGDIAIDDIVMNKCKPSESENPGECTFDNGLCGFTDDVNYDDFDWTWNSGGTPSWYTGPKADHTRGNNTGYYMFIEASYPQVYGDRAVLRGPWMKSDWYSCELNFYYHMQGALLGSLNIYVEQEGKALGAPIWHRNTTETLAWVKANAWVGWDNGPWRLVIEGVRGDSYTGDIAIDDIFYNNCQPQTVCDLTAGEVQCEGATCIKASQICDFSNDCAAGGDESMCGECDFENRKMCGWTHDDTADFTWDRQKGGTGSWNTGPEYDHTTGDSRGHYMFIEASWKVENATARIHSNTYKLSDNGCQMSLWYHMYGANMGTLNVYLDSPSNPMVLLFTENSDQGKAWLNRMIPIGGHANFKIIIEGVRGLDYQSDMAIDDVQFIGCHPGTTSNPVACDFQNNYCSYTDVTGYDEFDWLRYRGPTPSWDTGPDVDHTTGDSSGYYAYIESSYPVLPNHTAVLQSPWVTTDGVQCTYDLWYFMHGVHVDTLAIDMEDGAGTITNLATVSGEQGQQWKLSSSQFKSSKEGIRFRVKGVRGQSYTSDIAIDDLTVSNCAVHNYCPAHKFSCADKPHCIAQSSLCDLNLDCPDSSDEMLKCGQCTFEHSTCGLRSTVGLTSWRRTSGASYTEGTGPANDHTTGTEDGYYMLFKASYLNPGVKTALLVYKYPLTSTQCKMVFYYHMSGIDMGRLSVRIAHQDVTFHEVWAVEGHQGPAWVRGEVALASLANVTTMFVAERGTGVRGDIALDDITFEDCGFKTCDHGDFQHRGFCGTPGIGETNCLRLGCCYDQGSCYQKLGIVDPKITIPPTDIDASEGDTVVLPCTATSNPSPRVTWSRASGKPISANDHVAEDNSLVIGASRYWDSDTYTCTITNGVKTVKAHAKVTIAAGGCDFDHNLCGWHNEHKGDTRDWMRYKGQGPNFYHTNSTGPYSDYGSRGYYILLNAAPPRKVGDTAVLHTDWMAMGAASNEDCILNYRTYMKGSEVGSLTANLITLDKTTELIKTAGDQGGQWSLQSKVLPAGLTHFKVELVGVVGGDPGDIAIDDITLSGCRAAPVCRQDEFTCEGAQGGNNIQCIPQSQVCDFKPQCEDGSDEWTCGSCDFEQGECGYVHNTGAWFNWTRNAGPTPSWDTGPSVDHSTGTSDGHYMFTESSSPNWKGDQAVFSSPLFPMSGKICQLSFWYHMHGAHMGELSVFVNHTYGSEQVFNRAGNQPGNWTEAVISIGSHRNFNVSFVGTLGGDNWSSYQGDMAIDDIILSNCVPTEQCTGEEFLCANGTECKDARLVCDFNKDCSDGSDEVSCKGLCNFETDYCGWVNASGDYNLLRVGASGGHPATDHSVGTSYGHYLIMDPAATVADAVGSVIYPAIKSKTLAKCYFSFWYHMEGEAIGSLNVYHTTGGAKTKVWGKSNDQGEGWYEGGFFIGSVTQSSVTIETVKGTGTSGDIAIDDVGYHRCFEGPEECMADEFMCASGQCIKASKLCDLVSDCFDGSDEAQCPGNCNFEDDGLCGWDLNAANDDFNWIVAQGKTGSFGTGPDADHTLGTKNGHYVYIEGSAPRVKGDRAWMQSPWYINPTEGCQFSFWAHMMGADIGELNVYVITTRGKDLVWTLSKEQDVVWIKNSIRLPKMETFRILMEGVIGAGYRSDISLDDVSFTDCNIAPLCPEGEVACANGKQCIAKGLVCDFGADCDDGSDEANCGGCEFEHNTCGYTNGKGAIEWVRQKEQLHSDNQDCATGDGAYYRGPVNNTVSGRTCQKWTSQYPQRHTRTPENYPYGGLGDHNMCRNPDGHTSTWCYTTDPTTRWESCSVPNCDWYVTTSWHQNMGDQALLESPKLTQTASSCHVTFDYQLDGPNMTIQAVVNTSDSSKVIGTASGDVGPQWNTTSALVGAQKDFQLTFIATMSVSRWDHYHIALDSIRLADCEAVASIVTPPEDISVPLGAMVHFVCTAGGDPAPTVVWSNGKGDLGSANFTTDDGRVYMQGSDLYFKSTEAKDDGQYTCTATNSLGSKHASANLVIIKKCNFEQGMCGWVNKVDEVDDFDWTRAQAETLSWGTGPVVDHSTGSSDGWYVYIEASWPRLPRDKAILSLPNIFKTGPRCELRFWYHMQGTGIGSLSAAAVDHTGTSVATWMKEGEQSVQWEQGGLYIPSADNITLVFSATRGDDYAGDIALDDIEFVNCGMDLSPICSGNEFMCDNGQCVSMDAVCDTVPDCFDRSDEHATSCPGDCDFESGGCSWNDRLVGTQFNWTRHQGRSPSWYTGPESDHTTGTLSGHYIYLETSDPQLPGDKAAIQSPRLPQTSSRCFVSFWYHMAGSHIGSLELYKLDRLGNREKIWEKGGVDMGTDWLRAGAYVGTSRFTKFEFLGTKADGYQGDIAIDDINFGQCSPLLDDCDPYTQFKCYSGQCISADKICDLKDDCFDGSDERFCDANCNFEENTCGWHNDLDDQFDWSRYKGETASYNTGPKVDHTTLTAKGYYMYIETSLPRVLGDRAKLTSHWFSVSGNQCTFSFFYHMEGSTLGSLAVLTEDDAGTTLVFNRTLRADGWQHGKVPIPQSKLMRIILVGTAGSSYEGDIAIDDTSISSCKVTSACGQGKFMCDDKTCIPDTSECNFENDCNDGSDEMTCKAACTFESKDMCGWLNDITDDDLDWELKQGPTSSVHTGPPVDHTTGTAQGSYLYVEASYARPGELAVMTSARYTQSSQQCSLSLFTYMNGVHMGSLLTYVKEAGEDKVLLSNMTGDQGAGWKKMKVDIGTRNNFEVSLVAVMGASFKGDIAIDDLSFDDCALQGAATITSAPKDVVGIVGASVTLTCLASGDPTPALTWTDPKDAAIPLKSDAASDVRVTASGSYGQFMSITDARLTDKGAYKCTVTNSKNTMSASAQVTIQQAPSPCPSGKNSSTGSTPCQNCPVGTYQPSSGSISCIGCPSGETTNSAGSTSQAECVAVSQPCKQGFFSSNGIAPCNACYKGTYADATGSRQCKQCQKNTYQDQTGQKDCTGCPQGQSTTITGATSKDQCVGPCAKGSFSVSGSSPGCTLCDLGTYQPLPGQKICIDCPAANTTFSKGSDSLSDCKQFDRCPAGTFNPDTGKDPCKPCPMATYNPNIGAYSCKHCQGGNTTSKEGSKSPADCNVNNIPTTAPPAPPTTLPPTQPPQPIHHGLSTAAISGIGVVGGLVLMVVIVMMVLYMRHRNITAAPALVIEETVDYGASSNNSRTLIGFKNPMYDDHSGNKDVSIELSESNTGNGLGMKNPVFSEPDDI